MFNGVGAAVIGIIAMSAYKLTKRNVGKDKLLWAIYGVAAVITVITESEIAWLFIFLRTFVVLAVRAPPRWLRRGGMNASLAAQAPAGVASLRPSTGRLFM